MCLTWHKKWACLVIAAAFENDCRHKGGGLVALLVSGPVILVANALEALEKLGAVISSTLKAKGRVVLWRSRALLMSF